MAPATHRSTRIRSQISAAGDHGSLHRTLCEHPLQLGDEHVLIPANRRGFVQSVQGASGDAVSAQLAVRYRSKILGKLGQPDLIRDVRLNTLAHIHARMVGVHLGSR